jgi:hypothetical protein
MPVATITELLVEQDDPRNLQFYNIPVEKVADGQVLIRIDKFGLTGTSAARPWLVERRRRTGTR